MSATPAQMQSVILCDKKTNCAYIVNPAKNIAYLLFDEPPTPKALFAGTSDGIVDLCWDMMTPTDFDEYMNL